MKIEYKTITPGSEKAAIPFSTFCEQHDLTILVTELSIENNDAMRFRAEFKDATSSVNPTWGVIVRGNGATPNEAIAHLARQARWEPVCIARDDGKRIDTIRVPRVVHIYAPPYDAGLA